MKLGLWVLAALAAGIVAGLLAGGADPAVAQAARGLTVVGAVWLDALRMTIVPLIFSLLVAAIANISAAAQAGPLARRALTLFAVLIIAAAIYGIAATEAALAIWPVDPTSAAALVASAPPTEAAPALDAGAWLRTLLPTNIVAAAAEDAILPVVAFACLFGFAVTRLPTESRALIAGFFQAVGDAMIVIVRWVLLFAPLGVFGLALNLGLESGGAGIGALAHYVIVVSGVTAGSVVIATIIALVASRRAPLETLRALAPVQIVAASTQSSLATLPAMLTATLGPLGVRASTAEFVLPLAVAVFRFTSPIANLAVVMFVAHVSGVEPTLAQIALGVAAAFAVSVSSVGLPGQTSFFASIAPICLVMGVPVALLPILLAVEVIPDVFRTIGNVSADVAATLATDRRRADDDAPQRMRTPD